MELISPVNLPSTEDSSGPIVAATEERQFVQRRNQHVVRHVKVRWSVIKGAVGRIERIPFSSSAFPRAAVYAPAELIFSKK